MFKPLMLPVVYSYHNILDHTHNVPEEIQVSNGIHVNFVTLSCNLFLVFL